MSKHANDLLQTKKLFLNFKAETCNFGFVLGPEYAVVWKGAGGQLVHAPRWPL